MNSLKDGEYALEVDRKFFLQFTIENGEIVSYSEDFYKNGLYPYIDDGVLVVRNEKSNEQFLKIDMEDV